MPLFEAVQDTTPLVFDFGTAYTKCGFAGENAPKCIISSGFKLKNGKMFHLHDESVSEDQLHAGLIEFLYHIYFRELMVNPKVRRVVVMEPLFATSRFKHALAHILFMQYEVPSIYFASSHVFSLLSLGIKAALVIDCGYRDTTILPVYHSFPIFKACEVLPVAGKAIHNQLKTSLLEKAKVKTEERSEAAVGVYEDKLTEKLIENIKVKTCFVTRHDRALLMREAQDKEGVEKPPSPPSVDYPLDGKLILQIPGHIREETCEIMFDRSGDDASIPSLILQSISKCPIDTRRELMGNLVLMGGTAMLPGFKGRLLKELVAMSGEGRYEGCFKGAPFKLHTTPCMENLAGWLGGSIFSSVEVVLSMRSTPREHYLETKKIPDWVEIREKGEGVVDLKLPSYVPTPRSELLP